MQKKILVADDDPDIVKTLKDRLEFEGYEILVAQEGIRAIEIAHKQKPDLILLDIKMPAGKGDFVLEALCHQPDTKNVPVIVITALHEPGIREQMLSKGAMDFMQKPYNFEVLLGKIQSVFEGISSNY